MTKNFRAFVALVFFTLVPEARVKAADDFPAIGLHNHIAEVAAAKQSIVVVTEGWKTVRAQVRCLERSDPAARWKEVGEPFDAVVGKNGMAWGIGLHGSYPAGGPVKREGDGCAPAGVFSLNGTFGYAASATAGITTSSYIPLKATTEGVDDPRSRYYNRLVETSSLKGKDWSSSEKMLRPDGLYRWGVVVAHNWKPFPGYGSCIFLHVWRGAGKGTAGCTAMEAKHMERIVRWLDQKGSPILIQLPATEYARLKAQWMLP